MVKDRLKSETLIKSINVKYSQIEVRWHDGILEHYWYRNYRTRGGFNSYILPDEPYIGPFDPYLEIKPLYYEFQEQLDDYQFLSKKRDYYYAKFIPLRIFHHDILSRVLNNRTVVDYSNNELIGDFIKLRGSNNKIFYDRGLYRLYGNNFSNYGCKILEHFLKYRNKRWGRWRLYRCIYIMMYLGFDLTRHNISRYVNFYTLLPPGFYKSVFDKFKIKNMVIADLHPDKGAKALAAMLNDNTYYYGIGEFSSHADEISKFLDYPFNPIDPTRNYDLVILDDDDDMNYWRNKADSILLFTRKDPRKYGYNYIPVLTSPIYFKDPDAYYVFF